MLENYSFPLNKPLDPSVTRVVDFKKRYQNFFLSVEHGRPVTKIPGSAHGMLEFLVANKILYTLYMYINNIIYLIKSIF